MESIHQQPVEKEVLAETVPPQELFIGELTTSQELELPPVEAFLSANATLFADVDAAWRAVHREHNKSQDTVDVMVAQQQKPGKPAFEFNTSPGKPNVAKPTRSSDSRLDAHVRGVSAYMNNTAAQTAHFTYSEQQRQSTAEERFMYSSDEFDAIAEAFGNVYVNNNKTALEELLKKLGHAYRHINTDDFATLFETSSSLAGSYYKAYWVQDKAATAVEEFLKDNPGITGQFIDRVEELSEMGKLGLNEYPGLLEVLATRLADPKNNGRLMASIDSTAPGSDELAHGVLSAQFDRSTEGKLSARKETIALIAGMQFLANFVHMEYAIDQASLMDRLAKAHRQWPAELQSILDNQVNQALLTNRQSFKDTLRPFVRAGRLAPKDIALSSNVALPANLPGNLRPRKSGKKARGGIGVEKPTADVTADIVADVGAERPPIEQFAISKSVAGGRQYLLQPVNGLDELMSQPVIKRYLERHPNEENLDAAVRRMITYLTENPADPTNTTQLLLDPPYTIADGRVKNGSRPRTWKLFIPRQLPEVSGSDIIKRTRLTYGVVSRDSQPCLIIRDLQLRQSGD